LLSAIKGPTDISDVDPDTARAVGIVLLLAPAAPSRLPRPMEGPSSCRAPAFSKRAELRGIASIRRRSPTDCATPERARSSPGASPTCDRDRLVCAPLAERLSQRRQKRSAGHLRENDVVHEWISRPQAIKLRARPRYFTRCDQAERSIEVHLNAIDRQPPPLCERPAELAAEILARVGIDPPSARERMQPPHLTMGKGLPGLNSLSFSSEDVQRCADFLRRGSQAGHASHTIRRRQAAILPHVLVVRLVALPCPSGG
jgi:hypothetical protein